MSPFYKTRPKHRLAKKYLLLGIALLIVATASSHAQTANAPRQAGYWTLGLNAGFSYQSSDIQARPFHGHGLGLTLAKNLYYRPGAPIAFDLRGRLLFARQFGLSDSPLYDLSDDDALNGINGPDYTQYPAEFSIEQGFAFPNHGTGLGELGLEGVLTFNRLRERTGLVFELYGGLGLTGYRTKTDQRDANGLPYYPAYAGLLDERPSDRRRQLREDILDGGYETFAHGFDQGLQFGIMPSVGFSIGYQLSRRFSVHAGHRLTFTGTDAFEGRTSPNNNQDLYHYTQLGLRWMLSPGSSRGLPPDIAIQEPAYSPYSPRSFPYAVRADIRHVAGAADVQCVLNGRNQAFDFRGQSFRTIVDNLRPGENTLVITATNPHGSDREEIILIAPDSPALPPPPADAGEPPLITFTAPAEDPFRTAATSYTLQAVIRRVEGRNQITLQLNGRSQSFQFNATDERLTAGLVLQPGTNTIILTAENRHGRTDATTRIVQETRYVSDPPRVRILSPAQGERTTAARVQLEASVSNVSNERDIRLTVRGQSQSNFSFDPERGRLLAEVNLREGANTIEVSARTDTGSDAESVTVYRLVEPAPPPPPPPAPPVSPRPDVRIVEPADQSSSSSEVVDFYATVNQVQRSSELDLYVNNQRVTNFTFDYGRGSVTARLRLQTGNNAIRLEARTRGGRAEDAVNVRYQPLRDPVVRIDAPANGATFTTPAVTLRASLSHVDRRSDIVVLLNRRRIEDFSYDGRNLRANLELSAGGNSIEVIARTAAGQDSDEVSVTYEPARPPVVSINAPADGATLPEPTVNLRATITEMDDRNGLTVRLNGRSITNFSFDGRNLQASLTLEPRNNTIEVRAQNEAGSDSETVRVTYLPTAAPTVSIKRPVDGSVTEESTAELQAICTGIERADQLSITLNGRSIPDFDLNGERITARLSLRTGSNTILVRVRNDGGSDEDQVSVTYQRPEPAPAPPTVAFTQPNNNASVTNPNQEFVLRVTNLQSPDGLIITHNGSPVFDFSFGREENTVRFSRSLRPGANVLTATATNSAGSDEAELRLQLQTGNPNRPSITIESISLPVQNPMSPGTGGSTIKARLVNVNSAEQITLRVNDNLIGDFSFSTRSGLLTAQVQLTAGENVITIEAQTPNGEAEASETITF